MIKEYIESMQSENERKLSDLEKEMQELVTDLSYAERLVEEMQQEKQLDTNIFSPRAMNQKIDDQILEKQEKIKQLKQRMEYVTQMIQEGLKTREEYQKLEEEINEELPDNQMVKDEPYKYDDFMPEKRINNNGSENQKSEEKLNDTVSDAQKDKEGQNIVSLSIEHHEINQNEKDYYQIDQNQVIQNEMDQKRIDQKDKFQSDMIFRDELQSFLKDLYHRTETSLAFLNGNKNRCRAELKSCMRLIRDFEKKVENEEA